ncbi:predicted protein [Sclerotinia sclerotiorum 1980 UF-70]|uniref:Uncharacterized protein n=1 Tax=Sclerotinia sclerotiorum (strain ATCC 18683 / 1980 / Ss-1) TaxID=665079 RepID=A7F7P0_SCLS1|nr:predicted protein [Sclerotinia sclerotiorum 1980 UF-70]EDN98761.1 predicted protein [Sclerotinia sclerotiorum 1980 UF-70]
MVFWQMNGVLSSIRWVIKWPLIEIAGPPLGVKIMPSFQATRITVGEVNFGATISAGRCCKVDRAISQQWKKRSLGPLSKSCASILSSINSENRRLLFVRHLLVLGRHTKFVK